MTRDNEKRLLRETKRELKRAGRKKARAVAKHRLETTPEDAHLAEDSFGRYSTAHLNGMDHDATRRNRATGRNRSKGDATPPEGSDVASRSGRDACREDASNSATPGSG